MGLKEIASGAATAIILTVAGFLFFLMAAGFVGCSLYELVIFGGLAGSVVIAIVHVLSKFVFKEFHKKHGGITFKLFFFFFGCWFSVVILSMLAGFCTPVGGTGPLAVMGQELKEVRGGGRASVSHTVEFNEGEEFTANSVAWEAQFNEDSIQFCCSGVNDVDGHCEYYYFPQDSFQCTPQKLEVTQDTRGKIRAYCPVNQTPPCLIGFRPER